MWAFAKLDLSEIGHGAADHERIIPARAVSERAIVKGQKNASGIVARFLG
jgi:hypothetical protein